MSEDSFDKKNLIISFSGGMTSAYMAKWILENWKDEYEIIVVFANTGKEREETLDFANKCDVEFGFNCVWIEAITNMQRGKGVSAKVVDYHTASRNGEPFEMMIQKHGIPSVKSPHCTRELKKYAIKAYAKQIGWKGYYTAIGIRVDEIDRISPSANKERFLYPLVSPYPTRRNDINKFWHQQKFTLELKSYEGNCDLCFKKSYRKLMTLVNEKPELIKYWQEMEDRYNSFIPEGKKHSKVLKPPINFFRQNKSIADIVEMAKQPFELAVDESIYKPTYRQKSLFDFELDISNGCTESCDIF